jgi:hypothetical protein
MANSSSPFVSFLVSKSVSLAAMVAVAGLTGCSSVAPSRTASGAGTGAAIGGATGAVVGANSSMGTGTGLLGGAAAGAVVGGIVGMVQDAKDRKEQDRLSQERAYQQDLAKRRAEDARSKAAIDEELAIAEGFRISERELDEARRKFEEANARLRRLNEERSAALGRKKELDEAHEKTLQAEAKIAQLEEELARLKGEELARTGRPDGGSEPSPAEKPGT